jgi:activator of HSP90 ATPase
MIQKTIQLDAPPARVFEALTDPKVFSKLSGGAPADISADAGAAFTLFGGMIEGRNVECTPKLRLVQAWRPKTWQAGSYSLVRFELSEAGEKTELALTHTGFPTEQAEHLSAGWDANYLEPLKKLFA